MTTYAHIICERDGWTWKIVPQADCPESGIDLIYEEYKSDTETTRHCLGDHSDAKALAEAILAYIEFAQKGKS